MFLFVLVTGRSVDLIPLISFCFFIADEIYVNFYKVVLSLYPMCSYRNKIVNSGNIDCTEFILQ